MNMFENAARTKMRIQSTRGALSVEQLWDVPLRSGDGFDLNVIAKGVNRALKHLTEESFVDTEPNPAQARVEATFTIVKHVIAVKLAEEEASRKAADNRLERQKLLRILAEKQDGKLSELSAKQLKKRIAALEA